MLRTIKLNLPSDTVAELDQLAEKEKNSRSAIARIIVNLGLLKYQEMFAKKSKITSQTGVDSRNAPSNDGSEERFMKELLFGKKYLSDWEAQGAVV